MKKRILSLALSVILLFLAVLSCSSCSGSAPDVEEIRDRVVYLIEGSKELNVIFFGRGLPVYERDDALSEKKGVYYDDSFTSHDRVSESSNYITVEQIKTAADKIYSEDYLSAIYETAFEGVISSGSSYLRFYDSGEWLYQSRYATDFGLSERIYDYSTMKIVKPSSSEYVNIVINSYTIEDETVRPVTLSLVYERGSWYLDSPTY